MIILLAFGMVAVYLSVMAVISSDVRPWMKYGLWMVGIGPDVCMWHGFRITPHGLVGTRQRFTCNGAGCMFSKGGKA